LEVYGIKRDEVDLDSITESSQPSVQAIQNSKRIVIVPKKKIYIGLSE
jgi:hypothetical protein